MVYQERLTDKVAKSLVGGRYSDDYEYYLIIDKDTTSITCIDPETGKRVSLVDGRDDDLALDFPEREESEELSTADEFDYPEVSSNPNWFYFFLVIGVIVMLGIGGILWASDIIHLGHVFLQR